MDISSIQASSAISTQEILSIRQKKEEETEGQTSSRASQTDEYIPEDTTVYSGTYYRSSDGSITFDAPVEETSALEQADGKAQAAAGGQAMGGTQAASSTESTDEDTLEELEDEKEELEEQIAQTKDEDEKAKLKQELLQVEAQINSYQSESLE